VRRPSEPYVDILDDAIRHRINDMIDTGKIFGSAANGGRKLFRNVPIEGQPSLSVPTKT
jgi:hypothetical protein